MKVYERTVTPITLDRDGIAQSQTPGGAGDLTLNGAGVSSGVATFSPPRKVAIYSGSDVSARVFTIYGTDRAGTSITDTVTGVNNTTVSTTKIFKTVTRIAVDAGTGAAVEAGWTVVSHSSWIFLGNKMGHNQYRVCVEVTGTVNFDVEATTQNMLRDAVSGEYPDSTVTLQAAKTARTDDVLTAPYAAVRAILNSGSGSIKLRVLPSRTQ